MRIRTTRQAREIRAGIHLTRDPLLAQFIDYARPLTRRAYSRTRNRPPQGLERQLRQDHPERAAAPVTYAIVRDPYGYWIAAQCQWVDDRTLIHRSCGRFASEEEATAFTEQHARKEQP